MRLLPSSLLVTPSTFNLSYVLGDGSQCACGLYLFPPSIKACHLHVIPLNFLYVAARFAILVLTSAAVSLVTPLL